jgi:DNA-directed RNA polymerase subunit beta
MKPEADLSVEDEFDNADDLEPLEEELDIIAEIGDMDSEKFDVVEKGLTEDAELELLRKNTKKTKSKEKKLTQHDFLKEIDADEDE